MESSARAWQSALMIDTATKAFFGMAISGYRQNDALQRQVCHTLEFNLLIAVQASWRSTCVVCVVVLFQMCHLK